MEYQEYPKWVGGVVVNNANEEAEIDSPAPEGDPLVAEAQSLGIVVDKRWGDKRLAAEIAKTKG